MEDRYNVECCELMCAHEEIVEKVQKEMPDEDTLYDLTELFRIFGDSTRIRILYVLFEAEMCVCDIAALLGMTQSAISHQLRALKNAKLVTSRREGQDGVLFSGGRPCENHYRSGTGAYSGVISQFRVILYDYFESGGMYHEEALQV